MEASTAMFETIASLSATKRRTLTPNRHCPQAIRNPHRQHGTQSRNRRRESPLAGKRAERPQSDSPRPPVCRANLARPVFKQATGTDGASVREPSFDTTRCRNPFVNWRLRRGRIDACKPCLREKGVPANLGRVHSWDHDSQPGIGYALRQKTQAWQHRQIHKISAGYGCFVRGAACTKGLLWRQLATWAIVTVHEGELFHDKEVGTGVPKNLTRSGYRNGDAV